MNPFMTRGLYTDPVDIRRKVFAEVAKVILENDYTNLLKMREGVAKIPYRIITKEDPTYRCCSYKERAIVTERVRLALGLPLWEGGLYGPAYTGIEEILKPEKVSDLYMINVISEACEKCPTRTYKVTDNCRMCLAHPCSLVCPVKAVDFTDTSAIINNELCVKCGKCKEACPYEAIVNYDRPCAVACGVNAIETDDTGRAVINYEKCVRCGMCITACPFGAIADKSEFVQMLIAIKEGKNMYAIVAPSFVGQAGPLVSPGLIIAGIKKIGFKGVMEVSYGADVATVRESEEWYRKIYRENQPFLGTSCCPAWVDMARRLFPDMAENISDSYTPMVATGKFIKEKYPGAIVTFIGPCIAKKAESLRPEMAPYVDFVITFEELAAIFVSMDIDLSDISEPVPLSDGSGSGRHYATSGGVAEAVKLNIMKFHPDCNVKIEKADSLEGCKKMLILAKAKKLDANLLEGMACPQGCVGGPGILAPIKKVSAEVEGFSKEASFYGSYENPLLIEGSHI